MKIYRFVKFGYQILTGITLLASKIQKVRLNTYTER